MGSILKITNTSGSKTTWLPDPSRGGLSVTIQDLDSSSSTRSMAGTLIRDRVAVKRKISYSAPPLTNEEMSEALNALSDVFVKLEYPDPLTGTRQTITCYCGDRTAPLYSCINGEYKWENFKVDFIER